MEKSMFIFYIHAIHQLQVETKSVELLGCILQQRYV